MCADDNEELKHRGFACLANIVNAPGDVGKKGIHSVKEDGGVHVLQNALKETKNRDILGIGVGVLQKVS